MGRERTGKPPSRPIVDLDTRELRITRFGVRGVALSGEFSQTSKTANYTAADEMVILVDSSGGSITITLPPAATNPSKVYWIKNVGTGDVIVKGDSSIELIEGEVQLDLTLQRQFIMVMCSGAKVVDSYWHILGGIYAKTISCYLFSNYIVVIFFIRMYTTKTVSCKSRK